MNEFDLIKTYFAPLAYGFPGSLNLTDDAAVIDVPDGMQLVVTKDAIVEGVHFLGSEDAALIARKLLRVNLSDLAAKGATPLCYLLAVMLPASTTEAWIKDFASGLATDQQEFSIALAGGDTTRTNGTLCLTLTALGLVSQGQMLKRRGARAGDGVYVSGTLGDAALGLLCLQGALSRNTALEHRYFLPEPRLALGKQLLGIATSAMDISDGLVQDLGHICAASGVGAVIERGCIPLSDVARAAIKHNSASWETILAGGDDYEILFTAPEGKVTSLPVTRIGTVVAESSVRVLDESGKDIPIAKRGFTHFS